MEFTSGTATVHVASSNSTCARAEFAAIPQQQHRSIAAKAQLKPLATSTHLVVLMPAGSICRTAKSVKPDIPVVFGRERSGAGG